MKFLNKYTLLLLCLITGFSSCKKDKGTYANHEVTVPAIDSASLAAVYNIERSDNLSITPKINYPGDTANLSYQWLVYVVSSSSYTPGPPTVLSTQRNLNKTMDIVPGNYYLELIITDKTNDIKINSRSLLNVLALMESGWLVLHSANDESDIDFLTDSNLLPNAAAKRVKNMALTEGGGKLKGEGQFIGYSRQNNSAFNWITVGTSQEIKRYNGFSFGFMAANQKLFRRPQTGFSYIAHLSNGSNELLIDKNGLLQSLGWGGSPDDALYTGIFNGDYKLAPYIVFNDFSSYGALVYDEKHQRFMYTTQTLNALNFTQFKPAADATQAFDPSNIGKKMLFMDRGFNKYAYAFFKDNTGNGRYLYILNQTAADKGTLAVAAYDLSTMPEIQNAKFFQIGDVGNVALYATEKTIYKYDYSGSQKASIVFNGIPSNETITNMKIFKPKLNYNNFQADFAKTNNAVIYVATWDGTQGKLYELAMNVASGAINSTPLNIYDGFGKIKDMTVKFRGTGL